MVLGFASIVATSSTNLDIDSFEVYIGDVDGDGNEDLYLASIPKFVLIAMEINIPLTILDAEPVLFKGNGDGTFQDPIAWDAAVDLGTMSVADYTIHNGDFNGDGIQDLFFQSNSISYQSIVLSGSNGDTALVAQLFDQLEGKDVSSDYSSVKIEDVNGDGKDDIILDYGQSSETIALALATNRFNTVAYDDGNYQATYVPGSTSGQFSVSKSSGSASYAIPIVVPGGTAGVQPSLTISYNSSAVNGLMGVGFSLSGQSSVERCQKNRSLDGTVQAVDLASYESFCLDGNRMLPVDSAGREFRLAIDSFAKITSIGGTAAAPEYFQVLYKSGDLSTYGNSEQARQAFQGINSRWSITGTQDRAGNSIAYSYTKRNNVSFPSYIVYANNRIDFEYVDRADIIEGYQYGSKQIIDQILKKIDVSVDNHQFRSYVFGYELNPISEHSRLSSVTECGADGTCLKPTTFSWSEVPTGTLGIDVNESSNDISNIGVCENGTSCYDTKVSFADINGDGAIDMCYRDKSNGIRCRTNNGYGQFTSSSSPSDDLCKDGYGSSIGNCNDSDNYSGIAYQDFNLDGQADIIIRSDSGVRVYLFVMTNALTRQGTFEHADLNITDICGNGTNDSTTGTGCNSWDNLNTTKYADVNGDKIPDICYRSDWGIACALSTGSFADNSTPIYAPEKLMTGVCADNHVDTHVCQNNKFSFMDFNGDGMSDLVLRGKYLGVSVYYSKGDSFDDGDGALASTEVTRYLRGSPQGTTTISQEKPSLHTNICGSTEPDGWDGTSVDPECDDENNHNLIFYPDLNGDGNLDICWRADDGIKCVIGTGDDTSFSTAFLPIISTGLCKDNGSTNIDCQQELSGSHYTGLAIQFADFNNDGKSDLFYRARGGFRMHLFNGEGFSATADWTTSLCAGGSSGCNDLDNYTISIVDVDGDNLPDLVYRDDQLGFRVIKNTLASDTQSLNDIPVLADVVTQIETGMGITTQIEYTRFLAVDTDSSCTSVHCLPTYTSTPGTYPNMVVNALPMPLVKHVQSTASDGLLSGVRYRYHSYTTHADGYATPTFKNVWEYRYTKRNTQNGLDIDFTEFEPTTYAKHEYYTDEEYKFGRLNFTQSYLFKMAGGTEDQPGDALNDSNNFELAKTINYYEAVNSHSADERIQFIRLKNSIVYKWVKGSTGSTLPIVKTEDSYSYGSNGNVTRHEKEVTATSDYILLYTPVKTVTTITEYEDERVDDWIIGLVTKATVTKTVPNKAPGTTGNDVSTKVSSWQYNALGQVEYETVEPGTEYEVQNHHTYNGFGLKESQTVSAANVASITTTYGYDGLGKYITSSTMTNSDNEKSYTTSTTYDPVMGIADSKTSANGLTSTTEVDGYGRTISSTSPFGVVTAIDFEFSNDAYYTTTANNLGAASSTYFNKAGEVTSTRGLSLTGKVVNKQYSYFEDGATQWETLPYFTGGDVNKTQLIERDARLRPTQTQTPAGHDEFLAYNGFITTTTNSKQQVKILEKDALGQAIRSEDHLGSEVKFYYNADGQMISTLDVSGNTEITTEYDLLGRRTGISDPDKGDWSYTYNVLGKMITQTNANGQTTCMVYDELSRLVKRIDEYSGTQAQAKNSCSNDTGTNNIATWTYDTAAMGSTGKLVQGALHTVTGPDGYEEEYLYDNYGRVVTSKRKIANVWYEEHATFDTYGRALTHTYPSGLTTKNIYNSRGMLSQVVNNATGYSYWQAQDADAFGNITQEMLGDGITQTKKYSQSKGTIDWVRASTAGVDAQGQPTLDFVHSMDFTFDSLGNLEYRKDNLQGPNGIAETFGYDNLSRLTTNNFFNDGNRNGTATSTETYVYALNGNITNKPGVGDYHYDKTNGVGPHAVTSTELNGITKTYGYDNNGNLITDGHRTFVYSSFDKPLSITRTGADSVTFKYGPGRNRIERHDTLANGKQTDTIYAAAGYEIVTTQAFEGAPQKVEVKQYLPGGALIIEKTESAQTTSSMRFMLKDHIGSVTTIVDGNGTALQRFSFDAWGKRRNIDWSQVWDMDALAALQSDDTTRGFTGHEMLDSVGIIHMNGRIYDPLLGRFMNADPVIQAPTNFQSLNRYTYVLNNPLTLTDPSGHTSLRKFGRWLDKNVIRYVDPINYYLVKLHMRLIRKNPEVASIAGNAACASATAGAGAVACAGLVGAIVTYSVTGDYSMAMKAGATAAVTAYIWQGVGDNLGTGGSFGDKFGRTMIHGAVGGLLSVAQGGKFGQGFAAGAVSKGLNESGIGVGVGRGSTGDYFKNAAEAAFVGGTASVFAGGTFANGARTAAFARLFNDFGEIGELASREDAALAMKEAKEFDGVPYKLGGSDKLGIDCSNLVHQAYEEAGMPYSYRNTKTFEESGFFVQVSRPETGDVVLQNGHMGLYEANPSKSGYSLYSATSSKGVRYGKTSWFKGKPKYFAYKKRSEE